MSSLTRTIVEHHKEEYLQLIFKQKSEALQRSKQTSHIYIAVSSTATEELLSLCKQPICTPKKIKMEETAPMTDDDFLIAELNGHFR